MKYLNKFRLNLLLFLMIVSFTLRAQIIQIGPGSGSSSGIPYVSPSNYNYSQWIYTAAELMAAGATGNPDTLIKIKFKPTSSVNTLGWQNWTIYIGNTNKTSFSNTYDWVPTTAMTNVFNGDIPLYLPAGNWMEIYLTTPFAWDGTSNIVIAVDENSPSGGMNPNWLGYTLAPPSGSKSITFSSLTLNPDPTNPPTSGIVSLPSNNVPQIQLDFNFLACSGIPIAGIIPDSAVVCGGLPYTLVVSGATSFQYGLSGQWQIRTPVGTGTWTNLLGANASTYTVPSMPATPAEFRYALTCGSITGYSNTLKTTIAPVNQCSCIPQYSLYSVCKETT